MGVNLAIAGGLAVLLFVWAICHTPAGDKAEAEAIQANLTAQQTQMEAIFGENSEE